MNLKRKAAAAAVGAGALTLSLATAAQADVFNEYWNCTDNGFQSSIHVETCDGTWWHASPVARSIRIVSHPSTVSITSGWSTSRITYASSLDGSGKTIRWYCRFANGTSSSSKGTTSLGGTNPDSYTWPIPFGDVCDGPGEGIAAVVTGIRNGSTYNTTVEINDSVSEGGRQACVPCHTASS